MGFIGFKKILLRPDKPSSLESTLSSKLRLAVVEVSPLKAYNMNSNAVTTILILLFIIEILALALKILDLLSPIKKMEASLLRARMIISLIATLR